MRVGVLASSSILRPATLPVFADQLGEVGDLRHADHRDQVHEEMCNGADVDIERLPGVIDALVVVG